MQENRKPELNTELTGPCDKVQVTIFCGDKVATSFVLHSATILEGTTQLTSCSGGWAEFKKGPIVIMGIKLNG
jgi:hypothetical protein